MNGPPARPDVVVDWPPPRRPPRHRGRLFLLAVLAVMFFGAGTTLSYYVDALWFESLGYSSVFWTTVNMQAVVFIVFGLATFLALYGSFLALRPARLGELAGGAILINGQPVRIPVGPALKLVALGGSLFIAAVTGAGMMA